LARIGFVNGQKNAPLKEVLLFVEVCFVFLNDVPFYAQNALLYITEKHLDITESG
jgi:hypothetical protein